MYYVHIKCVLRSRDGDNKPRRCTRILLSLQRKALKVYTRRIIISDPTKIHATCELRRQRHRFKVTIVTATHRATNRCAFGVYFSHGNHRRSGVICARTELRRYGLKRNFG